MGRKKRPSLGRPYKLLRAQLKERGKSTNRKMEELVKEHSRLYKIDLTEFLPLTKSNRQNYAFHVYSLNTGYVIPRTRKKKPKVKKRSSFDKSEFKKEYHRYLKSSKWKGIRKEVIAERILCERCSSSESLQVHHKTYKNVFNEKMEDLELLCRKCHREEHNLK